MKCYNLYALEISIKAKANKESAVQNTMNDFTQSVLVINMVGIACIAFSMDHPAVRLWHFPVSLMKCYFKEALTVKGFSAGKWNTFSGLGIQKHHRTFPKLPI